ncbi:hypothetical protein [Streptomyces albicerus]|uniref:hypothetical protein n=1 Tax=Streptomyces albicerus TaxID=2569859 RepID=UPI00124B5C1D|nr:hypothetical protein [Streptomyces albicerus]
MKMQRALAAASLAVAATVLPLVVAAPAQASAKDCRDYLRPNYIVGPKVTEACAQTGINGYTGCLQRLLNAGVRVEHAAVACNRR